HLPGFDSAALRLQFDKMQSQAQMHLGADYNALLGNVHHHNFVGPDLLKRYLGYSAGGLDGFWRGEEVPSDYAALTKQADIYMRLPKFQVPLIITDTPGINGPSMLRDACTVRSLERSDLFILVLS